MTDRIHVSVEEGTLEGKLTKTYAGLLYKSFTGIPYAKPPLGNLRFRDPVPYEKWDNILDATKPVKVCAQFDGFIKKTYLGVEDCLYLNVYTPGNAQREDNIPVMFWIHGGGFACGSGNSELYGPDHLIQNNVILVTINYRLGPLGFLCLDIEDAPGNMGLKDQVLALRWVKKNVSAFGGDPNNITIFGESAGGSSVHHLIMSPMTKGLIKQAICQSGVSLCEWSQPYDVVKASFDLGEKLGLKTTDKMELIKFLRSVPVEKIPSVEFLKDLEHLIFAPVIEKSIPNVTPFCTEDIRSRMLKGDFPNIPVIFGNTSNEGILMIAMSAEATGLKPNECKDTSKIIPDFKKFIPMHLQNKLNDKQKEKAAERIKAHYFPDDKNLFKKLEIFQSDFCFLKDIQFVAKQFAKHNPTYFYRFSFVGSMNIIKYMFPMPYDGACHADELGYLFMPTMSEISEDLKVEITNRELLTTKRMTEMWTNFAKHGNPTPKLSENVSTKWEPVTEANLAYMDIGETLTFVKNPSKETLQFWEGIENL